MGSPGNGERPDTGGRRRVTDAWQYRTARFLPVAVLVVVLMLLGSSVLNNRERGEETDAFAMRLNQSALEGCQRNAEIAQTTVVLGREVLRDLITIGAALTSEVRERRQLKIRLVVRRAGRKLDRLINVPQDECAKKFPPPPDLGR